MRAHFRRYYEEEWCSALYDCYESGDDSVLNDLLDGLCPLIRRNYCEEVGKSSPGNQSYIEADALCTIYDKLTDKSIPNHHPKVFSKFLSRIITRAIRDSLRSIKSQNFDFSKVARYPATYGPLGQEIAECRIYEEQVRNNIRKLVKSKIRFLDAERDACGLIIDCLMGYKDLDPKVAKRRFNLSSYRCNYLINYVRILLKAATYEQREYERESGTFSFIRTSGGSILRAASQFW